MKRVALFPGQGSQKVGMALPFLHSPLLARLAQLLPGDLLKIMEQGPQHLLDDTLNAQPAIFLDSYMHFLSYREQGFSVALGHSVGEYAALVAAGCLSPENTMHILHKRASLMKEACQDRECGMLAVSCPYDQRLQDIHLSMALPSGLCCDLSVVNTPSQVVFSGDQQALSVLQAQLKKERVPSRQLRVSCAFHCSLLTPIKPAFSAFLQEIEIEPIKEMQVISNASNSLYSSAASIREGLVQQIDQPVLFMQNSRLALSLASPSFQEMASRPLVGPLFLRSTQ